MTRDEMVEKASERLEAVFSRAQKLVTEHFHGIEPYERERRIAILAYMKMLVELMKVSEP